MVDKFQMKVALRRNRQERSLSDFDDRLSRALGTASNSLQYLDPQSSVRREELMEQTIKGLLLSKHMIRKPELKWDAVERELAASGPAFAGDALSVFLCHSRDFAFRFSIEELVAHARALIDFDGDSVYAATDHVDKGMGIDFYESELSGEFRYTFDKWPASG